MSSSSSSLSSNITLSSSSSSSTPIICPFLWIASPTQPSECITYAQAFSTSYRNLIIAWASITYTFLAIALVQSYRVGVCSSLYFRIRYAIKHQSADLVAAEWTIQKRMHLMCTVTAALLCTRSVDPLGWKHVIPWGWLGLLTDAAGFMVLSVICSSSFSFIHLMYRISGRRGSSHIRHLSWMERCIHLVLLLSFTILSAQQAFTSPTYVFKATKFVVLIVIILSLMIFGFISGYTIVTALQKSISSMRASQPSPSGKGKGRRMSTTKIIGGGQQQHHQRQLQQQKQTPHTQMRTLQMENAQAQAQAQAQVHTQARQTSVVRDYNLTNVMTVNNNIPIATASPTTTPSPSPTPSTAPSATSTATTSPTTSPLGSSRSFPRDRPVSAADASLRAIKSMVRMYAILSLLGLAAVIFMIITLISIIRKQEDYFIIAHVPAPPASVADSSLPLDMIEIGVALWCLKSFRKISKRDSDQPVLTPSQRPRTYTYTRTMASRKTTMDGLTLTTRTLTQAFRQGGIGMGRTPSPDIRTLFMIHDGDGDAMATAQPETERDTHRGTERQSEPLIDTDRGTGTGTGIDIGIGIGIETATTPTLAPASAAVAPISPSMSFHPSSFDMIPSPSSFHLDGVNTDSTLAYVHLETAGGSGARKAITRNSNSILRVSVDYQQHEQQLDAIHIHVASTSP